MRYGDGAVVAKGKCVRLGGGRWAVNKTRNSIKEHAYASLTLIATFLNLFFLDFFFRSQIEWRLTAVTAAAFWLFAALAHPLSSSYGRCAADQHCAMICWLEEIKLTRICAALHCISCMHLHTVCIFSYVCTYLCMYVGSCTIATASTNCGCGVLPLVLLQHRCA